MRTKPGASTKWCRKSNNPSNVVSIYQEMWIVRRETASTSNYLTSTTSIITNQQGAASRPDAGREEEGSRGVHHWVSLSAPEHPCFILTRSSPQSSARVIERDDVTPLCLKFISKYGNWASHTSIERWDKIWSGQVVVNQRMSSSWKEQESCLR